MSDGFFAFVPAVIPYRPPLPRSRSHPSLDLECPLGPFTPRYMRAKLQVRLPRDSHCSQPGDYARNLNPGATLLRKGGDRGWAAAQISHSTRKASGHQTTSGQPITSTCNPIAGVVK